MPPTPQSHRVNVRLDTGLSAHLTTEAAWRRTTRSAIAATLLAWWLDGSTTPPPPADPPPPHPLRSGTTMHTSLVLPEGLWTQAQHAARRTGSTAPKVLTRLLQWMFSADTPPPGPRAR